MGIFVEITRWVLLISAALCFLEAMYRIVTEEDKCRDWRTEAITDLLAFLTNLILAIGLWLGW